MLSPRIKIATDILRTLSKSLERFRQHRDSSYPAHFQEHLALEALLLPLRDSLLDQAKRQIERHFADVELSLESAPDASQGCAEKRGSRLWILEPLSDPTGIFSAKPECALRLSEQYGQQLTFSLIYLPRLDELYCAERGYGVRMNDQRVQLLRTLSPNERWRIGAPSALARLKLALNHVEEIYQLKGYKNLPTIYSNPSLIEQIAALCAYRIDACWSGELSELQKKITGFWIKETATQRMVLHAAPEGGERSWIFGSFPTRLL